MKPINLPLLVEAAAMLGTTPRNTFVYDASGSRLVAHWPRLPQWKREHETSKANRIARRRAAAKAARKARKGRT